MMANPILSNLKDLEEGLIESFKNNPKLEMFLKSSATGLSSLYDYGLVLYTDGSSKEGKSGFGVHGYLYRQLLEKDPKAKKLPDQGIPKCFPTDRGYFIKSTVKDQDDISQTVKAFHLSKGNEPELYIPVKVEMLAYLDLCAPELVKDSTNNRAELSAMIYALRVATLFNVNKVHVRADSRLTINTVVAWAEAWASNNWRKPSDGTEPANLDLVKLSLLEKNEVKKLGLDFTIEWVKGHSDFLGNITADNLATRGRILAVKETDKPHVEVSEVSGYWKDELNINPLLSEPRFYYTTAENAGYIKDYGYFYHIGAHGKKDEQIGKRTADTNCSVIMLKEPDAILEKIRNATKELRPFQDGTLYDCRLDVISKPAIYNEIVKNGFKFMYLNKETGILMTHDDLPVLRIPKAPHLTFRAQGYFVFLENILIDYMLGKLSEDYVLTDITDSIYSITEDKKGKKKVKVIDVSDSAYRVNVNYPGMGDKQAQITLTYGIDIPRRLNLMRIGNDIDKVQVIAWKEGSVSFRYITLIITKSGECGVWSGAHQNLTFTLNVSK